MKIKRAIRTVEFNLDLEPFRIQRRDGHSFEIVGAKVSFDGDGGQSVEFRGYRLKVGGGRAGHIKPVYPDYDMQMELEADLVAALVEDRWRIE